MTLWQQLERSERAPPAAPALGYRGVALACGAQGRWFAYGGVVTCGDVYRRDSGRAFERLLLESAPTDLIPPALLRELDS